MEELYPRESDGSLQDKHLKLLNWVIQTLQEEK